MPPILRRPEWIPSARRRRRAKGDEGFSIVEAVIALMLLALVMVPVTRVVLTTTGISDTDHLRVEATDLANQALSQVTFAAEQGQSWTQGVTTSSEQSGADTFNVAVDVEPVNATALCTSGGSPQAWSAQAAVSWGAAASAGDDVVESTIIPAPVSTANGSGYGEIAIPVYGTDGSLLSSPAPAITITLTGTCTGGLCPTSIGSGPPYATRTASTGTTGCAVFSQLYAGTGWTYTATIVDSSGYVDGAEGSTGTGATEPVLPITLTATAGTVTTVPVNDAFTLAPGDLVTVNFALMAFSGSSTPPGGAQVPVLPITVIPAAGGACGSGCELGDASTSFNGAQQALLYPAVTASPTDDYSGWAGGTWADPTSSTYCTGSVASCAVTATGFESSSGSVSFPVYPLSFEVPASDAQIALSVTPVSTTLTIPLETPTGAQGAASDLSTTGLPLGEYEVSASTSGLSLPAYLWLTPSGVCTWTAVAAPTAPTTPCSSPSSTPIVLSVS